MAAALAAVRQGRQADTDAGEEDQTTPPEIVANPDLYNPGPGPYFDAYQGRSGSLPRNVRPEDAHVTTVTESDGAFPKLSVWVPSFRVGASEQVVLNAMLSDQDGKLTQAEQVSFAVVRHDNASAPLQGTMDPVESTPGMYVHAFKPPAPDQAVTAYDYAVYAVVTGLDGQPAVRTASSGFQVHSEVAQVIVADASVALRDGNLVVTLPVMIALRGNYIFYADLWGAADEAIAFAKDEASGVTAGKHVAELLFGGNIIRDRGVDGPYIVRNVRVRNVTDYPFAEAEPIEKLLTTPGWKADAFGQ